DRRALPAPTTTHPTGRTPHGPLETTLATVFAEVLETTEVGADEDFFALGGHSLLAARVISRLRERLGIEGGIRDVFEAPTVAALAARLAGRTPSADRPGPAPVERPEPLPLSYAQRGLWFLQQVDGPSATYTIPFVAHLDAAPDAAALTAAVADLVARHESLRTVFAAVDGEPHQHVLAPEQTEAPVVVADVRPEELATAVSAALAVPFDVAAELPLRVHLLRTPDGGGALVIALHHIAGDEASRGPLLADLQLAYAARLAGRAPEFTELPLQYADFALWQAALPQDAPLDHWRTALTGLPEEIALPTDRPRPALPSGRGGLVALSLPDELALRVRELARTSGASVFMVAHAAVAALLHRLGAGEDVPLGTPVAGRAGEQALDGLVGFFVNTLVLRTDLSGDPTFAELLDRVRSSDLAALDRAEVPFGRVVEAVNPVRSLGRHPLFQTMVSHNTVTLDTSVLFGSPARVELVDPGTARFDLEFTFADSSHSDALDLRVFYSADLFDRASAEELGRRLIAVLDLVAADPSARVAGLDLFTEADRALLAQWNGTDRAIPAGSVVELFAARA
ncbi:condensation domain-containing protein, partial [Kitasatospora sp. NPDC054939]